jgi:hypothetical protein
MLSDIQSDIVSTISDIEFGEEYRYRQTGREKGTESEIGTGARKIYIIPQQMKQTGTFRHRSHDQITEKARFITKQDFGGIDRQNIH